MAKSTGYRKGTKRIHVRIRIPKSAALKRRLSAQESMEKLHDAILKRPISNYATPEPLVEMIEELVAANRTGHVDQQSEETLTECRICGEWEGCKDECPGPWLDVWLNGVDALPGNLSHVARLRGSQLALPGMKKR